MKKLFAIFGILFVGLLLLGCLNGGAAKAKAGDTVTVDYTGYFEDGSIFDTNVPADAESAGIQKPIYTPLEFKINSTPRQVIPGFENAVIGMSIGEEKMVRLEAKDAYGERSGELIRDINLSVFEGNISVGAVIQAPNGITGVITRIINNSDYNEPVATVDFNPQLAGKVLIFKIKLLTIK